MTNIADKLVSYAVANNSTLAQKFFSDKRKVFNTEILDNHVYVNLPKKLSDRFALEEEFTKIGLVFELHRDRRKTFYVCINLSNV
jgi:hypothetical protein